MLLALSRTKRERSVPLRSIDRQRRDSAVLVDEAPQAYKDIDEVMENARELVETKFVLKQFINVKGD